MKEDGERLHHVNKDGFAGELYEYVLEGFPEFL